MFPFKTILTRKTLIFWKKKSENVSNFRQIFRVKLGPLEQHKSLISENPFLKCNKTSIIGVP